MSRLVTTSVVGSHAFPGWLFLGDAAATRGDLGADDKQELIHDAITVAVEDQQRAGVDVITDGEMSRLDFNLGFYQHFENIEPVAAGRQLGAPAHDQRGRYRMLGEISAPRGLGAVDDFLYLKGIARTDVKACLPGPFTLSGRLIPDDRYPDRMAITEALIPIVRAECEALIAEGADFLQIDEPSFSVYPDRIGEYVDIFNRTVEGLDAKIATHLCFGNYRARAVGRRRYGPLFPMAMEMRVDQFVLEFASREFAELDLIAEIGRDREVAIGVVDVKNLWIEQVEEIVARIESALKLVPPEKLTVVPDCGFSQTARWAAVRKLQAMVEAARVVRTRLAG
ncbi:methionine synthase [Candidatus Poribacteria bacterium]|jgi:5-methyltetrahydropteroyltriglutamate--homocysteine methyltransferase|nr:methionine synthase [Candidatus Poribacteria bacterium]MBT5714074.1 methionine synthase [Candidatus Poribacteria bacterium]MBT7808326.1 methionine synthase [Candidatus Poribacteria bacterium]